MDSDQPNQELEVIAKLIEFIQSSELKGREHPVLNFNFNAWALGGSGDGQSQWQAVVTFPTYHSVAYGYTLEQAAEQLLDVLLHPEKYQNED